MNNRNAIAVNRKGIDVSWGSRFPNANDILVAEIGNKLVVISGHQRLIAMKSLNSRSKSTITLKQFIKRIR